MWLFWKVPDGYVCNILTLYKASEAKFMAGINLCITTILLISSSFDNNKKSLILK